MAGLMIDGAGFGYDDKGTGTPVVLIHGDAADRRMWDTVAADLARSHRVIWYDRRGYGESADPTGPVGHHADLLELLDNLEISRAALIGCSMGGACALDVTLTAPDRVSALGLVSSGASGHAWPDSMLAQGATFVKGAVPDERLAAYSAGTAETVRVDDVRAMALAQARFLIAGPERDPADVDNEVWQLSLTMLEQIVRRHWSTAPVEQIVLDPPGVTRLHEVAVPTLVVNGLQDAPGIQDLSDTFVDGIHDVTRVDLPNTAHTPPMERPTEVAAAIRDLLSRAGWQ